MASTFQKRAKSRPIAHLCDCGKRAVQYHTADGIRSAEYCGECSVKQVRHI